MQHLVGHVIRKLNQGWVATALLFALTLTVSWSQLPHHVPHYAITMDRIHYVSMARGDYTDVIKPFSKRILHPLAARAVSARLHVSLEQAFFLLALLGLATFVWGVTHFFRAATGLPAWYVVPLVCSPYAQLAFADYYMHDLFFSALSGLVFLALLKRHYAWTSVLAVLLFLTREATLLLCVVTVGVLGYRRQWKALLAVVATTGAALAIAHQVTDFGQGNRHALGEVMFMVAKLTYNFFANFLGVNLWVNTYQYCTPMLQWSLPTWVPSGAITQVGMCSFDIFQPIHTATRFLTTFGILPTVLMSLYSRTQLRDVLPRMPLYLIVPLLYGLLAYALGPLFGPGGFRLMGYGWPAFWLAAPVLLAPWGREHPTVIRRLLPLHVLITWLPAIFESLPISWGIHQSVLLICAVTAHAWVKNLLTQDVRPWAFR